MFSSFYKHLTHLRIPLEDIVFATNNFSDANIIRESAFGTVYQLLNPKQQIDLVAERSNRKDGQGNVWFWKEISMLSSLKQENIVSIVGFCDENSEKIIVYKHEANGSLDKFLSDPILTWMRRLQICVGVAQAVRYIHHEEEGKFSIIHCDVRSSKILLDDNWEAKLSGFEHSVTQTAARGNLLYLTDARGTQVYSDPYAKSGSVTPQSDIYSLGVVLFEVLCGKKAIIVNEDDMFLAPLAKSHYERAILIDMIDPGLLKQMDQTSFKIFTETAYYCLKEQPSQRPNIDQIVIKLEGALEAQRKREDSVRSIHLLVIVNRTFIESFHVPEIDI